MITVNNGINGGAGNHSDPASHTQRIASRHPRRQVFYSQSFSNLLKNSHAATHPIARSPRRSVTKPGVCGEHGIRYGVVRRTPVCRAIDVRKHGMAGKARHSRQPLLTGKQYPV